MKRILVLYCFCIAGLLSPELSFGGWELDGTLPSPVALHGSVVSDGDGILVFGGQNSTSSSLSSSYIYYPGDTKDLSVPDMPDDGRHSMGCVKHLGKVYSIAGYNDKYASGGNWARTTDVWGYNPVSNSWGTETSLSYARAQSAAASLSNNIYVIGGHHEDTGHGFSLSLVEKYNPSQGGSWQSVASLNYDREGLGAVSVDGKIYAIGGLKYDYPSISHTWEGHMEVYDPSTDTWTEGLSMLTPRSHFGITVLGDKIYTIGGWLDGGYSDVVEYYDISQGQWFTDQSLPFAIKGAAAVTIENNIYLIGGLNSNQEYLNTVYTIPEPATLLLLGLGGMVLRKRCRA